MTREEDRFYDDLFEIYRKCPRRDIKIIICEMNAKIGKEEEYRPTIGKYRLHDE